MTVEEILDLVDEETQPGVMSKAEARDFMRELIDALLEKIEALEDEIGDDDA